MSLEAESTFDRTIPQNAEVLCAEKLGQTTRYYLRGEWAGGQTENGWSGRETVMYETTIKPAIIVKVASNPEEAILTPICEDE